MRNSQLAILCAAVLGGSLIVAGTNSGWCARWRRRVRGGGAPAAAAKSGKHLVIAVMPKAKGDPYFVSCRVGAEEAAKETGHRADLGRADGARSGQAERSGRELDYAQGGRDRGERGEPGGHFDGAAQGARARHQGADVGRRRGARRARLLHQPGDAGGDRATR